jgi:RimJ/RimL family protein N-acetyltransferase
MLDDRLAEWIANRIPGMSANDLRRHAATVGIVLKGELIAAMACGGKERGNVEITFAADSPKWATRETIAKLMRWPFVQLDCHRVTTRIAASNHRAIRFNEGIGFKREGVIREGWGRGRRCDPTRAFERRSARVDGAA